MKVLLLDSSLRYIWWTIPRGGMVKVHAVDSHRPTASICGRAIPSDAVPLVKREISADRLCGRCLASLRTYTSDKVQFESEVPA